jgi:nucleoside-diphosphate-sugar epimerase
MKRWQGNNGPEQTDYVAMKNLIEATPKSIKRFVLTTSAGVDRSNQLPFSILNLFGGFLHLFS